MDHAVAAVAVQAPLPQPDLDVPSDLRLLSIPHGYIFRFETGKLLTASKNPIDLKPDTLHSQNVEPLARRFSKFIGKDHGFKDMLTSILPLMSESMEKKINQYLGEDMVSRFRRRLWTRPGRYPNDDDSIDNFWRGRKYRWLASHPPGVPILDDARPLDAIFDNEHGLDSWRILTDAELDALSRRNPVYQDPGLPGNLTKVCEQDIANGARVHRFSAAAAAAAVHFLNSISATTRPSPGRVISTALPRSARKTLMFGSSGELTS
ncbi:hypothetical protein B0H67DRAFT_647915 [Lasiosphaeris hirsuta]|uniref:Uncharacterized protein n=1 Tax=Lasiosphaeris hirsuta TaxID=260670 RepID=A0AA40A239_9PEZI|nr:hypothetical protein B0H67DRAFT_647915 [Lasiosphaeris hirsuta]